MVAMAKKTAVSKYLAEIGRKGGQKRVPKGTAALTPEERTEQSRNAAIKRWEEDRKRKARAKKAGKRTK